MIGPEQLKQIPGEAPFWVSQTGRVLKKINDIHPERRQWLEIKQRDEKGTVRVKAKKRHAVSRLVYSVFVGELVPGMVICHLNGDHRDNRWQNLYQGTQRENISHKRIHGTWQSCEAHPRAILTNDQALAIKASIDRAEKYKSGKLKRGEVKRIAFELAVTANAVMSISRRRSSYAELFK